VSARYAEVGKRDDARFELSRFVKERHLELRQSSEPAPANDLDLAKIWAARGTGMLMIESTSLMVCAGQA
jgi:hypothetical protein